MRKNTCDRSEKPYKKQSVNFTFVELLIIIAVIALLTALQLPALRASQTQAKEASCVDNMKQLGAANSQYMEEYGYYVPRSAYGWAPRLAGYLGGKAYRNNGGPLHFSAHTVLPPVFRCPQAEHLSKGNPRGMCGTGLNYTSNQFVTGKKFCEYRSHSAKHSSPPGSSKADGIKRASEIYLFLEYADTPDSWSSGIDANSYDRVGYRHPGGGKAVYDKAKKGDDVPATAGMNVTMCDGSVKNVLGNICLDSNDDGTFNAKKKNWADEYDK